MPLAAYYGIETFGFWARFWYNPEYVRQHDAFPIVQDLADDDLEHGATMFFVFVAFALHLLVPAWRLSQRIATLLASEAAAKCKLIISATPLDEEPTWDRVVVPELLRLSTQTLPALSAGFGASLLAAILGFWLSAIVALGLAQREGSFSFLIFGVLFAYLPFSLTLDVQGLSFDVQVAHLVAPHAPRIAPQSAPFPPGTVMP